MPVSTRQATPGPSTLASTALQPSNQSKNTRKRTNSETQEDAREVKKKIKIAQEPPPKATNAKDKKKRKKNRKKRRTSVVKSDAETEAPTRSTRRSAPLSSSGQTMSMAVDSVPTDQTTNNVKVDEDKEEPVLSSSDKGKGKARAKSKSPSQRTTKSPPTQPIASGSGSATAIPSTDSTSQELEIARLKEQLAVQTKLLERHENHIGHHHQSLTCQICLELMYKPYALAPCGHITCYGCLIRWFTAPVNPVVVDVPENPPQVPDTIETILSSAPARNGAFIRRRKKCPVCRAIVVERPVEMWGIKDMVAALVRSQLVDIPVAPGPPAAEEVANADPWRNVFRRTRAGGHAFGHPAFFADPAPAPREQDAADREAMGWYDEEDGGVHRCIVCYHEIWGGVCSNCQREYPGHGAHNDDEDDFSDGEDYLPFRHDPFFPDDEGSDEDGDDDGAGDWGYNYQLYDLHDGSEDDYEEGDEELHFPLPDPPLPARRRWGEGYGLARLVDVDTDEDDDDDDEDEESIYGGSFIDDAVRGGDGGDGVDEDEDDDDDGEVEFVEPPRLPARAPAERRRRPRRYEVVEDDEDDEDDDDEDDEGPLIQRRSTRVMPVVESDDESDNESDDSGHRRGHPPRHAQHRYIADVSDSDDDEDDDDDEEEEVDMDPPSRFRQRIYPVVDWDEDDEDDEDYDDGWD